MTKQSKKKKKSPSKRQRHRKARRTQGALPRGVRGGILGALLLGCVAVAIVLAQPRDEQRPVPNFRTPANTEGSVVVGTTVPEALEVRVIRRHPHARDAFTQGLLFHEGALYESTGLYGESSLRQVDLLSGAVRRRRAVDDAYFAEGLARVDDRLIQLTWREGKAFVYRVHDFSKVGEFDYQGEGWGLCHDGERLVMSDGSSQLTFRDPDTFAVEGSVEVTQIGRPVRRLNELECVDGAVYANIWQTNRIVRIDPRSGNVTAVIEAGGLLSAMESLGADVLNGITRLPESGHFLITGKKWPALFEVEFVPRS